MSRVTIIGNAAGGKSTICKAIVKKHQLPLHQVDRLQWNPGWQAVPEEEVSAKLQSIMQEERWLLDGWGPWHTIEERFEKADTIIFVDHPVSIHLFWAIKRQIKAFMDPQSVEKPEGCDLVPMTWQMLKMIWRIHQNIRPKLLALVQSYQGKKDVFHIQSPQGLQQFALNHC